MTTYLMTTDKRMTTDVITIDLEASSSSSPSAGVPMGSTLPRLSTNEHSEFVVVMIQAACTK